MSGPRDAQFSADDLCATIGAIADVVEQRLDEAKTLTERHVLAACEALGEVLAENQSQLADSAQLSRELSHDPGEPPTLAVVATRLLQALAAAPESFRRVHEGVAGLGREARGAEAQAGRMLMLVETVKRISGSTTLLALNTRIEASRLGGNEKALAVLSAEMRSLSDEVTRAAEAMQTLAGSLTESLPAVAGGATQMAEVCETQGREVSASLAPFEAAYTRAHQSAEAARIGSQERLQRIQAHYSDVIRHLQFQDRAQQQIQFAEDAARALATELQEIVRLASRAGRESALGTAVLARCHDLLERARAR